LHQLRRLAPALILLIAIVTVASLTYPSVTVLSLSTKPVLNLITPTTEYTSAYPQDASTIVLAAQTTSTVWYLGNPLCDPASMACTPQPLPTATITITQWSTYFYQTTVYTQIQSTYTTESVSLSTQTNYQTVAVYVAAGLSLLQFGLIAMLVLASLCAAILFLYAKRKL